LLLSPICRSASQIAPHARIISEELLQPIISPLPSTSSLHLRVEISLLASFVNCTHLTRFLKPLLVTHLLHLFIYLLNAAKIIFAQPTRVSFVLIAIASCGQPHKSLQKLSSTRVKSGKSVGLVGEVAIFCISPFAFAICNLHKKLCCQLSCLQS